MENIEKEIREHILTELRARAKRLGVTADEINEDENFIETGLVDSFGLLELLTSIEKKFNIQINFSGLDPSEFSTLKGIVFHSSRAADSQKGT